MTSSKSKHAGGLRFCSLMFRPGALFRWLLSNSNSKRIRQKVVFLMAFCNSSAEQLVKCLCRWAENYLAGNSLSKFIGKTAEWGPIRVCVAVHLSEVCLLIAQEKWGWCEKDTNRWRTKLLWTTAISKGEMLQHLCLLNMSVLSSVWGSHWTWTSA